MKNVFESDAAWLAHEILRKLSLGQTPLQGCSIDVTKAVIAKGVIRDLVRQGFMDAEGALTKQGRFAVAYPHLAGL